MTSTENSNALATKFSFVSIYEKAKAFDDNNEVAYTWELIANDPWRADLKTFVLLAMKDEILSMLFPFTSLSRLCFSRCTGYPYTYDTPIVVPVAPGQYEVQMDGNKLGSGNAEEALVLVKKNLPDGIQPAIRGTAEDL